MDMETWFAPAIEMGRLVRQYRIAQEDEKRGTGASDPEFRVYLPVKYDAEL